MNKVIPELGEIISRPNYNVTKYLRDTEGHCIPTVLPQEELAT